MKKEFGTLFRFEMKKILDRKSVWIVLALLIAFMIFYDTNVLFGSTYIDGEFEETHAKAIAIDSENARNLSGQPLDDTLLQKMQNGFTIIAEGENTPAIMKTDKYKNEIRPYSAIYYIAGSFTKGTETDPLYVDAAGLYAAREKVLEARWKSAGLSASEIDFWQEKEQTMSKPYTYQYADVYKNLIRYDIYMIGLMMAFFTAICVTEVFCEEHNRRTDQLVLSSRFGRKELYAAKILAGSLFSLGAAVIFLSISVICHLVIYGADGFSAMVQLYFASYSYPLTMGELFLIVVFLLLMATLLTSIFAMIIAEVLHNSLGAMATVIAITFLARLIPIPEAYRVLSQLWNYIPVNLLYPGTIVDVRLVSIFGSHLTIWQTAPFLYMVIILILFVIGKKVYCNYQVNGR